jgi:tetraacyldisaccharide 4'-kinase
MREPAFWWRKPGLTAGLLAPLALIYGAIAGARLAQAGGRAQRPVVCVGNFIVGGAGKTPMALAVAHLLAAARERPAFLCRGYGGRLAGPLRVDPARHRAQDVGDEPLLLARAAETIVAKARVAGAALAVSGGASVVVMDDGFQNPSLVKDFSVLVVDAVRGVGNGRVIPAGPLRAPLAAQLARTDALVVIGTGSAAAEVLAAARAQSIPVFAAKLEPDAGSLAALRGKRVLAFAGIGDPEKFFATLREAGVAVAATRGFADHHRYTAAEARELSEAADRDALVPVTTEKDYARLAAEADLARLAARARVLSVRLVFDDEARFNSLLLERVAAARRSAIP